MNTYHCIRHRKGRRTEQGFTLIELLVVIAVLAILAAIVALNLLGVNRSANSVACKTDLRSVQSAADAFHSDKGFYAASLTDLVPTYLHSAPNDLGNVTMNSDGQGTVTSDKCS